MPWRLILNWYTASEHFTVMRGITGFNCVFVYRYSLTTVHIITFNTLNSHVTVPKNYNHPFKFSLRLGPGVGKNKHVKFWQFIKLWIKLICMKYQMHWYSGQRSVPDNKEQPFQFTVSESPIMQALWKLAMSYWAQWERSCRFQFDTNKVLDPNGNFTVQLCHSELKRAWHRTEFGDIGPIMSIVSGRAFRALAKRSYLFRIRDNKYKRTAYVCAHCAVTAALTCVIFLISKYKYTGHLPHSINCRHFTFSPSVHSESRHTSEIWKVVHCFRTLNCDHWACGFNCFLKKDGYSFGKECTAPPQRPFVSDGAGI